MAGIPAVPPVLKAVAHYMKVAAEYEQRDPVITYWCRLHSLQVAMKIDKKSKESLIFLGGLMDWLEKFKAAHMDNEAITTEVVSQAHVENCAINLFSWADNQDRAGNFNKNVVKAFYTAGMLFDVLFVFGEIGDECLQHQKYSKWKAAYIHKCLKTGEIPVPGAHGGDDEDGGNMAEGGRDTLPMPPQHQENFSAPTSDTPTDVGGTSEALDPPVAAGGSSSEAPSGDISRSDTSKAQKLCKFAVSALDYDDVSTAIENLEQALALLKPR